MNTTRYVLVASKGVGKNETMKTGHHRKRRRSQTTDNPNTSVRPTAPLQMSHQESLHDRVTGDLLQDILFAEERKTYGRGLPLAVPCRRQAILGFSVLVPREETKRVSVVGMLQQRSLRSKGKRKSTSR